MVTPVNEFDIALQATVPRLLETTTNSISLSPSSSAFTLKADGYTPASITILAGLSGALRGTVTWTPTIGNIQGNLLTLQPTDITQKSVNITATINYLGVTYSKSVTITKIEETATISLSADSAVVLASPDGTADSAAFTNIKTTSTINTGSTDDTANWTHSWSAPPTGVTVTLSNSNRTLKVDSMLATLDSVTFTLTATKTGRDPLTKTFTVTKSKQGADSVSYSIVTSSPVITKQAQDAATPGTYSTINISGIKSVAGQPDVAYGYVTATGNGEVESLVATASISLTPASTSGKSYYTLRLYDKSSVGSATLLDTQTVYVVYSGVTGAAAISVILSNDTHVFTATSTGAVPSSSYTGSGTEIRVYEGATELTYDGVGTSAGTWKITLPLTTNNITAGGITDSGTYATVGQANTFVSSSDAASITYTITGKSSLGVAFTATKTQTFSKSKQGIQGDTPSTADFLTTSAAYTLTGDGGIRAGNITWNSSTGAITGGGGIVLTSKGLLGAKGGLPTFTITDLGVATFKGDVQTSGDVIADGNTTTSVTRVINGNTFSLSYSVYGKATDNPTSGGMRTGIFGQASGSSGGGYSVGVAGIGADVTGSNGNTIGVLGSSGCIGGWFESKSLDWAAVYALNNGGGIAIKAVGNIICSADIIAFTSSDRRLKDNIAIIPDALNKVARLSGVTFDWKQKYLDGYRDSLSTEALVRKHDVGVIAQEVLEVLPEAVHKRAEGTLAVNYEKLVPLLLEAIKELSEKVKQLEERAR